MLSQEIRRNFLKYFKDKGHAVVSSSSVVPHDDPTLLFINAGMNQFKDVFLGKNERDYKRATTSQKCIRVGGKHNDLDNVGHTSRHLTFFEMLGNFSFGDYFKEQAITFAWEVSTTVFGFDPEKIWVTVFQDDDEAFDYWKKIVPEKRIVRMGEKDNFWAMGDTGPCGPCSELLYDRGEAYGSAKSPKDDVSGERYLEFWNLVFMQFNRDASGKMQPLPKQSIDTGAGLERVVSLKMGVDSVYATDIFVRLIGQIEKVCGKTYDAKDPILAPAFHVIADHIRSISFAVADGATPSNIERGYILRKLLRRAVRYGRMLGMHEPFMAKVLPCLIEIMGADYKELSQSASRIAEILTSEEEAFLRTLKRGGNILNAVIEHAQKNPLKQISGEEAFKLKDTYGLPLEEILLIAKDSALTVNLDAYALLEEAAKEKSRSAQTVHLNELEANLFKDYVQDQGACNFVGYQDTEATGRVTAIVHEGKFVTSLPKNQEGMVILDTTCFYAEKGGQLGDKGTLSHKGAQFTVNDCHNPQAGVIVHIGRLEQGTLQLGDSVQTSVDTKRRQSISNNHTATHLLHWALQKVLGEHIRQAGSLVEPTRLRFDFNHHKALSREEIRTVEDLVNEKIRENRPVNAYELSYEDAQGRSDIKQFFGEKYGRTVRVVDIEYSKELCGGTHTQSVGTIGFFRIAKEGSVAAGVRRIEGVTGKNAEIFVHETEEILEKSSALLKATPHTLLEKLNAIQEENRLLKLSLKQYNRAALKELTKTLCGKTEIIGTTPLLAQEIEIDPEYLNEFAEDLMQKNPSLVLLLGLKGAERCQILVRVSKDLVTQGVSAVQIVKEIAPAIGGSGGGKPDSAQAGGKNSSGIPQAFELAKTWLKNH